MIKRLIIAVKKTAMALAAWAPGGRTAGRATIVRRFARRSKYWMGFSDSEQTWRLSMKWRVVRA
ncbi:hypothetical protein BURMUCF2_A2087 [Burkholderia multivorans CF2]|nr:hypothetical protein BURMUCF2_A2087 [Burkholderia multivorans CF2]